jgi:hypothetical protein
LLQALFVAGQSRQHIVRGHLLIELLAFIAVIDPDDLRSWFAMRPLRINWDPFGQFASYDEGRRPIAAVSTSVVTTAATALTAACALPRPPLLPF